MKRLFVIALGISLALLTACGDVQIFKEKVEEGIQTPVKADELEMGSYYIKDGTSFILTLPLRGSGSSGRPENTLSDSNKERVLFAGPNKDTLIPTHYKGEIVAQAAEGDAWQEIYLERFKDMGYSVGFYNGEYDPETNCLSFTWDEKAIEDTDFKEKTKDLESHNLRVVGVNHQTLSSDNADFDSGILINMNKGEEYLISLYAGTYYHEIPMKADTQMFQSFELYKYGTEYIKDTPNGYRKFTMPEDLKSGYYAIDSKGLFRYVDYIKGEGNIEITSYNDEYYTSDADKLANFSKQYSFSIDSRTRNLSVVATYDGRGMLDEETIEGYIFSPDGTEYHMNIDPEKDRIWTDFAQAMPGKWTVNIVPMELEITSFDAIDNTPEQELTQEVFKITLNEDKENVILKTYFTNSVANEQLDDITITGDMIAPDGETYILKKTTEETLDKQTKYLLEYEMPYAPRGKYTITVNHYPERTTIQEPQLVNMEESVTDVIVVDG